MTRVQFLAAAVFSMGLALPASAQAPRPAEMIALSDMAATAPVSVLGTVSAEYHQKSMFSKTDPRVELQKQLRAAAAKLGADAVVDIKYEMNSPMLSKKGQLAKGTAVKFLTPVAAPVQVAAAPAAVAPPVSQPVTIPPPAAAPAAAAIAPPVAAPVVTPPVIVPAAPSVVPSAPAAAPAVASGAIALSEGDAPGGRAYTVVGAVVVEARPQLDKAPKQVLDEALREKAKALGADAVIQIRYEATGASAQGVAVKFR